MLSVPVNHRGGIAYALVDDEDLDVALSYRWSMSNGYAKCTDHSTGRVMILHRLIMGLSYGDGLQVDHINREKLDNRRANLRVCTVGENRQNLDSYKGASVPYRGVSYCRQTGLWKARCKANGVVHWLGRHATPEAAAKAAAAGRALHLPFSVEALERKAS
jgi:hypothetical protein